MVLEPYPRLFFEHRGWSWMLLSYGLVALIGYPYVPN